MIPLALGDSIMFGLGHDGRGVDPMSFKCNLRELVAKSRASGVRAIILSTNHRIPVATPMPNGQDYNANNRQYHEIIRRVVDKIIAEMT